MKNKTIITLSILILITTIMFGSGITGAIIKEGTDGTLIGNYSDSGGSYIDTQNTTDESYWYFGSNNKNYDITAYAELNFNLTVLEITNYSSITNLNFSIDYCHSGNNDNNPECNEDRPIEGTQQGDQNVEIYNVTAETWLDIGNLRVDDNNNEITDYYNADGNLPDFINPITNEIKIRFELDYVNGKKDNSWLLIDYVNLNITYIDIIDIVNNTTNVTTDNTANVTIPALTVWSPANTTYTTTSINATIITNQTLLSAKYSLNGANNITLVNESLILWTAPLNNLTDGTYNIVFYGNNSYYTRNTTETWFTINTSKINTTSTILPITISLVPSSASVGGGSGMGGGILNSITHKLELTGADSFTVEQGKDITKTVSIKNIGSIQENNVKLAIEGIPSSWYVIETSEQDIAKKAEKEYTIQIKVPTTAEPKTYTITFKALNDQTEEEAEAEIKIMPSEDTKIKIASNYVSYSTWMNTITQAYEETKLPEKNTAEVEGLLSEITGLLIKADSYIGAGEYFEAYAQLAQAEILLFKAEDIVGIQQTGVGFLNEGRLIIISILIAFIGIGVAIYFKTKKIKLKKRTRKKHKR
ncbi:MAG: hypothetical protein KJ906_00670 [Nanoarchaeota archaeon]|nr:hypothetical protein [Nanoarchaeota archaeon]